MTRGVSSQVFDVGFRLVNFETCMIEASKYSVASLAASSQNFLSSASLWNLGMALEETLTSLSTIDFLIIEILFAVNASFK